MANGWTPFPGDKKALWEANLDYRGEIAFGKTVTLTAGRLNLLPRSERPISAILTNGTVTWPPSNTADLGCGGGVAKLEVSFETRNNDLTSFVGCVQDSIAPSYIPAKVWGTFIAPKQILDDNSRHSE